MMTMQEILWRSTVCIGCGRIFIYGTKGTNAALCGECTIKAAIPEHVKQEIRQQARGGKQDG